MTADSAGNVNTASQSAGTVTVASSDTTVATVAVGSYDSTNKWLPINVTGVAAGKATITISDTATGLVIATAPVIVSSAVAAAVTLTLDNSVYAPGALVTYTLSATDSTGAAVADGVYTGFTTAALAPNQSVAATLIGGTSITFVSGSATGTFYAPAADFLVSGTLGAVATVASALQSTTVTSATATVQSPATDAANAATDAANEATDAANAATDAANAAADSADAATQAAQDAGDKADAALAAVTALSQQVTTLLAKVAALASTLAKITKAIAALPKK